MEPEQVDQLALPYVCDTLLQAAINHAKSFNYDAAVATAAIAQAAALMRIAAQLEAVRTVSQNPPPAGRPSIVVPQVTVR